MFKSLVAIVTFSFAISSLRGIQTEDYLFVSGFFNGTQLFNNLNGSDECLSLLPVVHEDFEKIVELIEHTGDVFEKFEMVIERLKHLLAKMEDVKSPCNSMRKDIEIRFDELRRYLLNYGIDRMIFHAITYSQYVNDKYKDFRQALLNREYYISGYYLGDLVRFMIFWDYTPDYIYKFSNNI
jgi:hypothetical protein